jgi:parvulin-like peptidyl-prolyl isomerase
VSVSDDDILERYDALLVDQKETYEIDPSQYVSDIFDESIIAVRPSGFRHIKNIVIPLPDEIMARVSVLESELYEPTYILYMIDMEMSSGEIEESELAELQAQRAAYQAMFDELSKEIDDATKAGLDEIRPKAEEVLALCRAEGADFDALLAEYSSDRPTGELLAKGYPVAADVETYVPSFTEAAMALENIGDVSDLVESVYGYHILQYAENVTPGVVPLGEVNAAISDLLFHEKEDQLFNDEATRITEDAKIQIYITRL